jgi:hypothetical protein
VKEQGGVLVCNFIEVSKAFPFKSFKKAFTVETFNQQHTCVQEVPIHFRELPRLSLS